MCCRFTGMCRCHRCNVVHCIKFVDLLLFSPVKRGVMFFGRGDDTKFCTWWRLKLQLELLWIMLSNRQITIRHFLQSKTVVHLHYVHRSDGRCVWQDEDQKKVLYVLICAVLWVALELFHYSLHLNTSLKNFLFFTRAFISQPFPRRCFSLFASTSERGDKFWKATVHGYGAVQWRQTHVWNFRAGLELDLLSCYCWKLVKN